MKCTLVKSTGGERWVLLHDSERVFYDYNTPEGWVEADVSWTAMSRHMFSIEFIKKGVEPPIDLLTQLGLK